MPIIQKPHIYLSKDVRIRGYFSKTKGSVVKHVLETLMYKKARSSLAGQHGGERGEFVEVEEYSRNKQDQPITRSNSWHGTLMTAPQCYSSIVSKEGHLSEVNLHHLKVVITSELFLTSHFTRTVNCPLLCTLG